jgi:hypothetical protein
MLVLMKYTCEILCPDSYRDFPTGHCSSWKQEKCARIRFSAAQLESRSGSDLQAWMRLRFHKRAFALLAHICRRSSLDGGVDLQEMMLGSYPKRETSSRRMSYTSYTRQSAPYLQWPLCPITAKSLIHNYYNRRLHLLLRFP